MNRGLLSTLIKELLVEHHLLSASDIVSKLAEAGHKYNKTSIYRSLDRLVEVDVLCRQRLVDHQVWYELRHDHLHLVCDRCGRIEIAESMGPVPEKVGSFQVAHQHITLYGICHECQ